MFRKLTSYSHSAPKISTQIEQMTKNLSVISLSPGATPSNYSIKNFPVDPSVNNSKMFFFDSSISIAELKLLGELSPVDSFDLIEAQENIRKTKSACRSNILSLLTKNPVKEDQECIINSIKKNIKKDSFFKNIIIEEEFPCVKLQEPPPKSYKKRVQRCTYEKEEITKNKIKGVLKKYNLKTRYGFIKTQESKIFFVEDDLVLSGVDLKEFKDNLRKKISISFECDIKKVWDKGKEIEKAVNIEVRYNKL